MFPVYSVHSYFIFIYTTHSFVHVYISDKSCVRQAYCVTNCCWAVRPVRQSQLIFIYVWMDMCESSDFLNVRTRSRARKPSGRFACTHIMPMLKYNTKNSIFYQIPSQKMNKILKLQNMRYKNRISVQILRAMQTYIRLLSI